MRYDLAFAAEGYHSALMTTFRFDPPVFEDVVLVRLRGSGCRNVAVLADTAAINLAFSESGPARLAGRRYHLAKTRVSGCFHPKIVLQLGQDRGRLMIGSANLTGAGLRSNFEVVSTIEVTAEDRSAAPLFASVLDYIRGHADDADQAMRQALERARRWTPWLDGIDPDPEAVIDGRMVRFVTEAEAGGIAGALERAVAGDRPRRLVCVAPYWDRNLAAVERLRQLSGGSIHLVVDSAEQDFTAETFASLGAGAGLHAIDGHALVAARIRPDGGGGRRLHAKVIVAEGDRFDHVLAGSANITLAGLFSSRSSGNAEAGLLVREPAGSAVARLGLEACLARPFPTSALWHRRSSDGDLDGAGQPRDGGTLTLHGGGLEWHPPPGVDPGRCTLDLFDEGDLLIEASATVDQTAGRWWVASAADLRHAGSGRVSFEDHVVSAPIRVAGLDRLRVAARPPLPTRFERFIGQIACEGDPDIEGFELLEAFLAQLEVLPGDGRTTAKPASPEGGEPLAPLDPEAFAAIARREDSHRLLRATALGALRSLVDRAFGIYAERDDADQGGLEAEISGKQPTSDDDDDGGGGNGSGRPRGPAPRRARQERIRSCERLVARVAAALARPGEVDPLEPAHLIRLRYLVAAILNAAAPAGVAADDAYPLAANAREASWVLLLGRLLLSLSTALALRAGRGGEPPDEEQVDLLALLRSAAILCLGTAQRERMASNVTAPLMRVAASLEQSIRLLLAGDPGMIAHMERSVSHCDRKLARLAGTAAAPSPRPSASPGSRGGSVGPRGKRVIPRAGPTPR